METCILVVDDEGIHRRMVRRSLSSAGFRVLEAENGKDALALVDRERPNLILLDLGLPDIPGTEVARRARGILGEEVRVLLRSAKPPAEVQKAVLECGADGRILKNVVGAGLLARIETLLED